MPPDAALDDDEEEGEEMVTIVCPQSIIDGVLDDIEENDPIRQSPPEADDASGMARPLPGESFRDYMERMDRMKEKDYQEGKPARGILNFQQVNFIFTADENQKMFGKPVSYV